jgi:hypothetical protein
MKRAITPINIKFFFIFLINLKIKDATWDLSYYIILTIEDINSHCHFSSLLFTSCSLRSKFRFILGLWVILISSRWFLITSLSPFQTIIALVILLINILCMTSVIVCIRFFIIIFIFWFLTRFLFFLLIVLYVFAFLPLLFFVRRWLIKTWIRGFILDTWTNFSWFSSQINLLSRGRRLDGCRGWH